MFTNQNFNKNLKKKEKCSQSSFLVQQSGKPLLQSISYINISNPTLSQLGCAELSCLSDLGVEWTRLSTQCQPENCPLLILFFFSTFPACEKTHFSPDMAASQNIKQFCLKYNVCGSYFKPLLLQKKVLCPGMKFLCLPNLAYGMRQTRSC